jgi:hypothetical protein
MTSSLRSLRPAFLAAAMLALTCAIHLPMNAQQILGAITGTVRDASGSAVPDVTASARNTATNLTVAAKSQSAGSYTIPNLPAGTYELTFTKEGFDAERHTEVLVNGDRTTTVDGDLKVGTVATKVDVIGTPLMNQTDTTTGYVVDTATIQNTPLGTGSFTQLAIMSPGVHADFLAGAGSNSGLGNQAIFANGQRDTSNSFSLNGISTNNLFNGNSTSQVGEDRFSYNIGESFGAGGQIQTSTSVYGAIGQALPTPPPEAIQEIAVNSAMYDATQGANSGAHISVLTKSGSNELHGEVYEKFQNSYMNAEPFFYNASPILAPNFLNRNQFGATLGGPIKKNKLFYFLSYQGIRIADSSDSTKEVTVPLTLTNDRSTQGIINTIQGAYGKTLPASSLSPQALGLLQAKGANGQYLIPSAQITNPNTATILGYDAVVQGANAQSNVDQGIANVDYEISDRDRLGIKYYVQTDPTTNPFGAAGVLLGFPQQLSSGSQVISLNNTVILTPSLTWQQRAGFTRMRAYSTTSQAYTPSQFGINLPGGSTAFPQIEISEADPTLFSELQFGPSTSFGNAGMFQNQWEYGTSLSWVKGRHTLSVGVSWDHTQLNIINNNVNTDVVEFKTFESFAEGDLRPGNYSSDFAGSANRYYRSDTVGTFVNDNYKLLSNLTVTLGLRWDFDGPLSEKYGRLTAFNPSLYSYNASTDTIVNSGLEIAGNNPTFGTPGASDSLMKARQWGLAPRIGIAWAATPKLTVRTGFGIYYDRGEFFSYLSPPAGAGFNGPFGVTLAPPFVSPEFAASGATLANPFGSSPPPTPAGSAAAFTALLPNIMQTENGHYPAGNAFGPFVFGGYDINNKLPYTENWTFDLQYQMRSWLFSAGYVGNHGQHEILPIPFNEPSLATPGHPVNGQSYSYGGTSLTSQSLEPVSTGEYSGNAPIRVPYIGYDMNSVLYEAEGVSNYDALQLQVRKRYSNGLQFTASYTRSHSLDEQSGLGLFLTGNNPDTPRSSYASSDFDRPNVFLINYSYTIPNLTTSKGLGAAINGWIISGQTVAQSGEPYSVYDYSGSVGSLYFGTDIEISNPIVPLKPGITAQQAELQGTTGVNAGRPVLNVNDFYPQFVMPGTNGVPPCQAGNCDAYESLFSNDGRNLFRGPFGVRFDMSLGKEFTLSERFRLRFNFDAFNVFNHPDFDAPNNQATFFAGYSPPPLAVPEGSLGIIQHTIGSSRFLQLSMNLRF